jgi:hypothetical protein
MLSQNFVQRRMTCRLNTSFKTSYSQPSQIDIERKSQSKRYKHTRYKSKPYDGQDRPRRILICNLFIFCSHHAKAFFSGRASVARRVKRTYQQVGLPETPPPFHVCFVFCQPWMLVESPEACRKPWAFSETEKARQAPTRCVYSLA